MVVGSLPEAQRIRLDPDMSQRRHSGPTCYVDHPRFGKNPIVSGYQYSDQQIQRAHWRYAELVYFRETAIPARTELQRFSIFPRAVYVDIEERCIDCGRPFLFFALEQQFWFETLGFWVDAHCIHCVECRKRTQEIRAMQRRYQVLVETPDRSAEENRALRKAALELCRLGYVRDPAKV